MENENGIHRNPFINSGSIVVADCLLSVLDNPKKDLLSFVREISNDENINYDQNVAESEKITDSRNIALIYYMKSLGNIQNNPENVLYFYF